MVLVRIFSLLILFILLPFAAHASNWINIESKDGVSIYVETTSINRKGGKVKIWLKSVSAYPFSLDNTYPKKTYKFAKVLFEIECNNRNSKTLRAIYYGETDADNDIVRSVSGPFSFSEQGEYNLRVPAIDYVCSQDAPPR